MSGAVQLITRRAPVTASLRGHSSVVIRDASESGEQQQFSGIASRTELDRVGDEVVAAGITFTNPVVLLWQHRHDMPIGRAWLKRVGDAIHFDAKLPKISEPGPLRDRVREAFIAVREGIVDSVSIGFKPLADPERLPGGGLRYPSVEVYELSLVSVPALQSARIDPRTVKALDHPTGTDRVPMLLTRQQLEDLRMAAARRALGKMADKPVPAAVLHATVQRLHEQDQTIAGAIAELDDRLSALESGRESGGATRAHPGAVRLIRVVR